MGGVDDPRRRRVQLCCETGRAKTWSKIQDAMALSTISGKTTLAPTKIVGCDCECRHMARNAHCGRALALIPVCGRVRLPTWDADVDVMAPWLLHNGLSWRCYAACRRPRLQRSTRYGRVAGRIPAGQIADPENGRLMARHRVQQHLSMLYCVHVHVFRSGGYHLCVCIVSTCLMSKRDNLHP